MLLVTLNSSDIMVKSVGLYAYFSLNRTKNQCTIWSGLFNYMSIYYATNFVADMEMFVRAMNVCISMYSHMHNRCSNDVLM